MTSPIPSGFRVLVVEDEFAIAAFTESVLEDLGCYVVGPADTVGQALALGRSEVIDAAFLDVRLGKELSIPVANVLAERKIPFALLTGYDGPIEGYPPAVVLTKPFGAHDLEKALRTCLGLSANEAGSP